MHVILFMRICLFEWMGVNIFISEFQHMFKDVYIDTNSSFLFLSITIASCF